MFRRQTLLRCLLALFFAQIASAVPWVPLEERDLAKIDPPALSQKLTEDLRFATVFMRQYYCSSPLVQNQIKDKFEAASKSAQGPTQAALTKALQGFAKVPPAMFYLLRLKGMDYSYWTRQAESYALEVHVSHDTSFIGLAKYRTTLLFSGTPRDIETFRNAVAEDIDYESAITEFRVEVEYKIGANWAEFFYPTGISRDRGFGVLDAWTTAGLLAEIKDNGSEGVRRLLRREVLQLPEGKSFEDKIGSVRYRVYLPFEAEPFAKGKAD